MELQLIEMENDGAAVKLRTNQAWATNCPAWHCEVDGNSADISMHVIGRGDTPSAAVEEAHQRWFAFRPKELSATTLLEAPRQAISDDDIPF